jgi:LysM repeat protein
MRLLFTWLSSVALAALVTLAAAAPGKGLRVHTVQTGQRLGSIAKRYQVSIAAICHANAILRKDPIHPGQRLIIPDRSDRDGSEARRAHDAGHAKQARTKRAKARGQKTHSVRRRGVVIHRVYRGQSLGSIAKRYHSSVAQICHANRIERSKPIQPGQLLVIPASDDEDGSQARRDRERYVSRYLARQRNSKVEKGNGRRSLLVEKYAKPPWRKGYVTLRGYTESWKGYVIGPGNRVLGGAQRAITRVLNARRLPGGANWRLVRLIAKVSDKFGGRPIRVVCGYRSRSFARESRHKIGRAIDFSIPGVPNAVVRDYLLTLPKVGVGYYPNSSFVHLDVRDRSAFWVDLSGPGEPPRYVENPGKD